VADFGIAKALSSARQQSDGGLTTFGTSLGTPAYMAPEQVAGDPDTDSRADIYSLGCVAYEMLCGQTPFAGKSPQQMLAAQVMEQPVPISQRRPDTPPALAALVMKCLEKDPSKRPQSAVSVAALSAATGMYNSVSVAPPRRIRRSHWVMGAVVVALVATVARPVYRKLNPPAVASSTLNIAVAPFEVLDPQLALWKEGIVDVLSRNLDGAGPIRALSPSVTIKRWEGHAERTAAVTFGKRVGAQLVIYGQLQSAGQGLVDAKLWIVDAEQNGSPVEVDVRDSIVRMDRVADSLSIRSLAAIGHMRTIGAARLASLGSNSLPAIRAFLQGAQYFRRAQWDSAAAALQEATTIDSTFGIAYAMLGEADGWIAEGGHQVEWSAFERAGNLIRPGLSSHDSLTLVAVRHFASAHKLGQTRAAEFRDAYAAAKAVTERYPDDAAAWYFYSDLRFHYDKSLTEREALANFDHAIQADSDFAPAYIHAIELAYRNGPAAGRRYATAAISHSQSAQEQQADRLVVQMADGKLTGIPLRAVLDTLSPAVGTRIYAALRRLPDSAEVALDLLRAGVERGTSSREYRGLLADELGFRGHINEGWRWAVEVHSYVATEIAALGLVPADSAERALLPWVKQEKGASFFVMPALAAARDTASLTKLIGEAESRLRTDTGAGIRISLQYFGTSARAYLALAKGDTTTATHLFDGLSDSLISLPVDQFIRARLISRQDPRRALAILERMSTTGDLLYVARQLERGRIAERLGDKERAVDAFAYVAAAWRNSESEPLRDAVKEATGALARLDADGRTRAALTAVH